MVPDIATYTFGPSKPLVSIGMPVYNGQKYLREALDSLLAQSFGDFEIIICDNASTDGTEAICQVYAEADRRIRYSRNERNIGPTRNHNRTFELSEGKYFMWAAYDDVYGADLLAKCVAAIESDPSIVLCHSTIVLIDDDGKPLRTLVLEKGKSAKPYERLRGLIRLDHTCDQIYGLIRADVLRKTRLHRHYTDSDRTLLAELSLYGRFFEVEDPLFFRRVHAGTSTHVYPDWRARMALMDPSTEGRLVFPHWLQFFDYLRRIFRPPLATTDRLRCLWEMFVWMLLYGKAMLKDLLVAIWTLITRAARPLFSHE